MNKLLKMANYYNEVEQNEKAYGVFSYDKKIEDLLSNHKEFPHALLVSFIVDDETDSGEAEKIPMKIYDSFGTLNINELSNIEYSDFIEKFKSNQITSNPEKSGSLIFDMISLLISNYDGDASNIWKNQPNSKELKKRLIEFKGMNSRKVNLFCLVLINKFKLKISEYSTINISNDSNIRRAMEEIKLIDKTSTYEDMKYVCKILSPTFPGVFDTFFWAIGEYFFNKDKNFQFKMNDSMFIENCIIASLEIL